MPFTSWPDIESLSNVVRGMRKYKDVNPDYKFPIVTYRGKVKLDGTNAGIRIDRDGNITAQSRSQDLSLTNDNCGFARFVQERRDLFLDLTKTMFEDREGLKEVVIFGEWVGKGIQKGTSVSTVAGKYFCVFAVQETSYHDATGWRADLYTDIDDFNGKLSYDLLVIDGVKYLGWEGPELTVDFGKEADLTWFSETIEKEVLRIEACDPWVKSKFGAEGVGEGLVYYPIQVVYAIGNSHRPRARDTVERLMFKAKGYAHRVKKAEKAAPVDVEALAGVQEFVDAFVTVPRLEQGATFVGGTDIKKIGDFLKWFGQDVEKESKAELETSGLTWKQVSGPVQKAARNWFLEQSKKL